MRPHPSVYLAWIHRDIKTSKKPKNGSICLKISCFRPSDGGENAEAWRILQKQTIGFE